MLGERLADAINLRSFAPCYRNLFILSMLYKNTELWLGAADLNPYFNASQRDFFSCLIADCANKYAGGGRLFFPAINWLWLAI